MSREEDWLQSGPVPELEPGRAEQIRRRAHVILRERARALHRPVEPGFWGYYHRLIEPCALLGLGVTYLIWTLHDTVVLFVQ